MEELDDDLESSVPISDPSLPGLPLKDDTLKGFFDDNKMGRFPMLQPKSVHQLLLKKT